MGEAEPRERAASAEAVQFPGMHASGSGNRSGNVPGLSRIVGDRQGAVETGERDRRMSQASNVSAGTSVGIGAGATTKKPSINDYKIGEELGRGSYSTVSETSPPMI